MFFSLSSHFTLQIFRFDLMLDILYSVLMHEYVSTHLYDFRQILTTPH
jgi:hypothetical protein